MNWLSIILAAVFGRPAALPREEQKYTVIEEMTDPTPQQRAQWAREDEVWNKKQNDQASWWSS